MKLTLGFSPCPNDTFIFDALVNNKIDTEGLEFEVVLEDVQTLNNWAINSKLDISKISYGVLPLVLDNYIVLNSGGALGKGVGPLLITKNPKLETGNRKLETVGNIEQGTRNAEQGRGRNIEQGTRNTEQGTGNLQPGTIETALIAIPGKNTTAHMLFSLAYPNAKNKVFKVFNEIEDFVLGSRSPTQDGHEERLGVIIHENRFTYHLKGLHKVIDLGEFWEQTTGLPIPLGGIVAKRTLGKKLIQQIDRLIKKSVEYAYANNHVQLTDYVKQHSQEMSEDVMRQHIDLYVNNYSIALGDDGKNAVKKLLEVYGEINGGGIREEGIFVEEY